MSARSPALSAELQDLSPIYTHEYTADCGFLLTSGGGFRVVESKNVTVADITIDYDPLPYTQATILAMSPVPAPLSSPPHRLKSYPPAMILPCMFKNNTRPHRPCPDHYWEDSSSCFQSCPSNDQQRNPVSGRCLRGEAPPSHNIGCVNGLACAAGECVDPKLAAQTWKLDDKLLPGYVVNMADKPPLCLNVKGCTTALIYDGCCHSGGTCAGKHSFSAF